MRVGVLGISYRTADLRIREELVRKVFPLLDNFPFPVVFLSTCNRMEIYFSNSQLQYTQEELQSYLKKNLGDLFIEKMYVYFGKEAFCHLCRVTAGIDSAVLGETEIQNQVKFAYQKASAKVTLPSALHYLFQKSLKIAKLLRNQLMGMPSLRDTLWDMTMSFLGDPTSANILFVGFSEINRQIIPFLLQKGCKKITLCSRQKEAENYMEKHGGLLLAWDDLKNLSRYQVIILATHAGEYFINQDVLSGERKTLIFDLGVPRNAHPNVALLPQVSLYNMQKLNELLQGKREGYREELFICEKILVENTNRLWQIYQKKVQWNSSLKLYVPRIAGEGDDVANILHSRDKENEPFKTYAKTAMGYGAVLS